MELHQLFKIQEIMEHTIRSISDFEEDSLGKENIFDLRFLAFQVKTSEIAHLTKCYKYSNVKTNLPKDKIFINYLDALGFLLSIGNVNNFNIIDLEAVNAVEKEESMIKLFATIFDDIASLRYSLKEEDYYASLATYIKVFARYIHLGEHLDFDFPEIYNHYMNRFNSSIPIEL